MPLEVEQVPDVVRRLRETCHDMRQPVASVLALAAATLTDPDLSAAARGRLEHIIGQAEWLADMIHDCLTANGQEEPGDIEESGPGHADVVRVVAEAIAAERLTWGGDITLTSPDGPVWCALYPVVLRRTVANVLGNAARAAGRQARSASRSGGSRAPPRSRWRTTGRVSAGCPAVLGWG